jgi:predicted outer membrane repeat protein
MRLQPRTLKINARTRLPLRLMALEGRDLPSASIMNPTYHRFANPASFGGVTPAGFGTPGEAGYTLSQIANGMGYYNVGLGTSPDRYGLGQTIAIVDAYDNPNIVSSTDPNFINSDLHKFDVAMGINDPPNFVKIDENGGKNYPAPNATWATEIALDVEWAHALAPSAYIVLVEATNNNLYDIYSNNQFAKLDHLGTAIDTARNFPNVSMVSMSFGGSEFSADTGCNFLFSTPSGHPPITFLASTGDGGAPGGYPAYSPEVVAVGGTNLALSGNNYVSETGWNGSGGGISQFETKPPYQGTENISTTKRTIPDVAFVAGTAVAVYDSYNNGSALPWSSIGGTSVACPCWAALMSIADEGRDHFGQSRLAGFEATLPRLYGYSPGILPSLTFHDITTGNNGYAAKAGYDLVTGWGSPYVDRVVGELIDDTTAPTVTGSFANVTTSGATKYTFNVTYHDNEAINPSTLTNAIHVSGPYGFSVNATLDGVNTSAGSTRVATYEFTPIGGSWDTTDSATYTISENANTAGDYHYNRVPGGTIGSFVVNIPSNFYVTNANNSGAGSLRQAVLDVNANGPNDNKNVIHFDAVYFQTPRTITLTSGALDINQPVTIQGPGINDLTVNGNGADSIFDTRNSLFNSIINISSMKLTGGKAVTGGAIVGSFQSITLNSVVFTGNSATMDGGAISMSAGLSLTANDCTFTNNTAGTFGGAIELDQIFGHVTLERCTISGNTAQTAGGFYTAGAYLLVDNSTIANNVALNGNGGGLQSIAATCIVRNSTIVGNSCASAGGGMIAQGNGSKLTVQNSTITANTASGSVAGGGGIARGGSGAVTTIESTIVSGNTNAVAADIYSATTIAANFSAIGDSAGFTLSGANNLAFGTDLQLGSLANNGGTTQTCVPASGSPVVNAGSNPAGLTTDQRGKGFPRLVTGAADIGAVETPLLIVTNTNNSGVGSLRQVLIDAQSAPGTANTITFDPAVFSVPQIITLTSGAVQILTSVTVAGPGADLLTINGNNVGGVIYVNTAPGLPVTVSGLTVTGGGGLSGVGIAENNGALTVSNCVITGNTVTVSGFSFAGGIFSFGGSLIVDGCTITGNSTTGNGGGIGSSGSLTIQNSTVANNKASGSGGGIYSVGNIVVENSTIANNSSEGSGGGIIGFANTLVENCTVSGNSASVKGGGIYESAGVLLSIASTIVAKNSATISGKDIFGTVQADYSLIGVRNDGPSFTPASANDKTGTFAAPLDPLLAPLANNGGPTQTMAFLAGSPCIDAGANPAALATDQRGTGYPRIVNGTSDIGAYEADSDVPTASGLFPGVTTSGDTSYPLSITYSDNVAISLASLATGNITITRTTGPTGFLPFTVSATFVGTTATQDGTPIVGDYIFTPPDGSWDAGDNGDYAVSVESNQVGDTSGNAVVGAVLGYITVHVPDTTPPTASASLPDITTGGITATTYTFQVTYTDDVAVAQSSFAVNGNSNIEVVGPGGFDLMATYVSDDSGGQDNSSITVTYSFTPPGGNWDAPDSGAYEVKLLDNQVSDTGGHFMAAVTLGLFQVNVPDIAPPTASGSFTNVYGLGGTDYTLMVTYTDDVAVSYASLQTGNILISGPGGSITATFVDASPNADSASITAEYHFTPPGGAWDASNTGTYSVNLDGTQVSDASGNYADSSLLGSFIVDPQSLAQVQSVVINGGAAQRSRVTSIVINFNQPVIYDTTVAGSDPFVLFKQGSAANVHVTVTPPIADSNSPTSSVTLTFTTGGPSVEFGSLADGRYTLQVGDLGSVTRSDGLPLDGDSDGQPGGTYTMLGDPASNKLFRLFGDANGDGAVGANDFVFFRQSFNGVNDIFDFDGDGFVSTSDFAQFRNRFNTSI